MTVPPAGWTSPPDERLKQAAFRAAVLGAVNVIALVLAVRLIVLVSVGGGILLTWMALTDPNFYRLGALGIYCALCVVPCIWLAGRR